VLFICASEDNIRRWSTTIQHVKADVTELAGVAIEMVDGGIIDGVTYLILQCVMYKLLFLFRLGDRKRVFQKGGEYLKISLSLILLLGAESLIASSITGAPGHCVEKVFHIQ
jgi:hypothetical protein